MRGGGDVEGRPAVRCNWIDVGAITGGVKPPELYGSKERWRMAPATQSSV